MHRSLSAFFIALTSVVPAAAQQADVAAAPETAPVVADTAGGEAASPSTETAAPSAEVVPTAADDEGWDEPAQPAEVEPMSEASTYYSEAYPEIDRGFNLLTARPMRPGAIGVVIKHRTNVPVRKDPWYNYLGFDAGNLKIGIVIRYGILENLDVGLFRLNGTAESFDTYELDARYRVFNQKEHGLDVAARAGITWFSQKDNQALTGFGELMVDRIFFDQLLIGFDLMFHGDSSSERKSNLDTDWSLGAGLLAEYRFTGSFAWTLEVTAPLAGYRAKTAPNASGPRTPPGITTGAKIITNRHTFGIVLSNTQYITTDGLVAGASRSFEDLIIGFNITREL